MEDSGVESVFGGGAFEGPESFFFRPAALALAFRFAGSVRRAFLVVGTFDGPDLSVLLASGESGGVVEAEEGRVDAGVVVVCVESAALSFSVVDSSEDDDFGGRVDTGAADG